MLRDALQRWVAPSSPARSRSSCAAATTTRSSTRAARPSPTTRTSCRWSAARPTFTAADRIGQLAVQLNDIADTRRMLASSAGCGCAAGACRSTRSSSGRRVTLWAGRVEAGLAPEVWDVPAGGRRGASPLRRRRDAAARAAARTRPASSTDEELAEASERLGRDRPPRPRRLRRGRALGDRAAARRGRAARSTRAARATTRSRRRSGSTSPTRAREAAAALARLRASRCSTAPRQEAETPMPGYTHLQRAQPVTRRPPPARVGRDARARPRRASASRRSRRRRVPLGAGALAGSTLALPAARRARCATRSTPSPTATSRSTTSTRARVLFVAPLADRRGARPLDDERVRVRAAARVGRDRLVDDAAEAQPRRRRARARQGRHRARAADRAARGAEGPPARLRPRPAGGQGARVRGAPRRRAARSPR